MDDDTVMQWYLLMPSAQFDKYEKTLHWSGEFDRQFPSAPPRTHFNWRYVGMNDNGSFYAYLNPDKITLSPKGNIWLITTSWLRDGNIYHHAQTVMNTLTATHTVICNGIFK